MSNFSVTILGNNSAIPAFNRHPTAQYISIGQTAILIDCGEGTQSRISEHPNCKKSKLEYIFISHLHGDHWLGLMGLLNTMALGRRVKPLHIFGHKDLHDSLRFLFDKMKFTPMYRIHFHIVPKQGHGVIYENATFKAEFFQLEHRIATTGYKITQKKNKRKIKVDILEQYDIPKTEWNNIQLGQDYTLPTGEVIANSLLTHPFPPLKSYAYCSDTRYTTSFLHNIENTTLAYIESTYTENEQHLSYERFHCTAKEAARIAKQANVQQLIIGHFSSRYKHLEVFEQEAKEIFPNTALALEGTVFEV